MAYVHFMYNSSTGYLARSHAFFGAKCIHVIDSMQAHNLITSNLYDHVKIIQHDAASCFLSVAKNSNYQVISTETDEASKSFNDYSFDSKCNDILDVGNEHTRALQ